MRGGSYQDATGNYRGRAGGEGEGARGDPRGVLWLHTPGRGARQLGCLTAGRKEARQQALERLLCHLGFE